MSAVDADRAPDPNLPLAGQSRSFVYMAMQGEQRLPFLNEPFDRDATDMYIQRHVLVGLPVQRRAVERRVARRRMEEKYCTIERIFTDQRSEVLLDRGPFDLALFRGYAPAALLRRDAARRDITGNVVTLPVFQQEWSRRNIGEAINGKLSQNKFLTVDVVPKAIGCCRDESSLFAAWVVIAKDQEDVRIVQAHGVPGSLESGDQIIVNEIGLSGLD